MKKAYFDRIARENQALLQRMSALVTRPASMQQNESMKYIRTGRHVTPQMRRDLIRIADDNQVRGSAAVGRRIACRH